MIAKNFTRLNKLRLLLTFLFIGFLALAVYNKALSQVTPLQIANMKVITSSVNSSEGKYVAYTLMIPADPKTENGFAKNHLYVLDKNTGTSKAYYTASSVSQLQFRPQKGTLTFVTKGAKDEKSSLYEIRLDGGEANKIFSYSENISAYDWNNDGNRIAFVAIEKKDKPNTSINYTPEFYEETFDNRNAYIANISINNSKPQKIDVNNGAVYTVKWSPDGNKLAMSVAPTSSVDDSYMKQQLLISDGRQIIAEVNNSGKLGQIAWSPDNLHIALISGKDLHDPTDGSLFIVSANGGNPRMVDAGYLGKYEQINWQNNQEIFFLSSEGVYKTIGIISPNGKNKQYICRYEDLNINTFSLSDNGLISFTANSPTYTTELFTLTASNNKPVRRTFSNAWLQSVDLGRQEVITYKTRDGKYDIQGMLIYPNNYVAGQRYPLITVVHGGPESHYSNGWLTAYSMPGQMATAKGYAVFYPNYRGSTGRGTAFTYSSQGDLAGKEFDDIVDGIDYLIDKGIVDKNRIGVTGGSYGGYASAWMSTYYSDRFAAAVMFVGISNNISKFGTSDIPNEMFLVHSRKRVWDDWKWQLERSPIYHVGKSQTPILIMHGSEDPRVHPAQSMELYRHLKVRKPNLPVRLIYYPGEGHGNARSGSRYDYNLRMMQWFDTYLKTGDANAKMPSLDLPE